MIAIIDYGVGNLFSLKSSLLAIGQQAIVTNDINEIEKAEKLILPGVGAFEDAINKLKASGLDQVILEQAKSGKPLLGICLGMQLLLERSYEFGCFEGLGLIKGEVIPLKGFIKDSLKVPHIGYNGLHFPKNKSKLFEGIEENDCVYFVHSYFASNCDDAILATTEYDQMITAAIGKDNVYGCQFHPEKSGKVGLKILTNFCKL